MKIEFRKIEELKRHPMNPKVHTEAQVQHIAESIRQFGFTQPVVIDEKNTILVGHARVEAATLTGLTSVPVTVKLKLKEYEKLALLLADNHLAQQTTMDELKYEASVRGLKEHGYDTESLGLRCEFAEPTVAESEESDQSVIKQIVVVFEAADFDRVIRKFDSLKEREKLTDYTEVFSRLLDHYEEAC